MQKTKVITSNKTNRVARYIYTPCEFGHTRTLRFFHQHRIETDCVKSLAVLSRARYEKFRNAGGFYSSGIYTRTIWVA